MYQTPARDVKAAVRLRTGRAGVLARMCDPEGGHRTVVWPVRPRRLFGVVWSVPTRERNRREVGAGEP